MSERPAAHYEWYEAPDGFRWRLRARNGKILSTGEAFASERNVLRAIETEQAVHGYGRLPVRRVDD